MPLDIRQQHIFVEFLPAAAGDARAAMDQQNEILLELPFVGHLIVAEGDQAGFASRADGYGRAEIQSHLVQGDGSFAGIALSASGQGEQGRESKQEEGNLFHGKDCSMNPFPR